ncbi:sugar transferase [candidate division KSB1 bacterium]|nr:sugar transferase [candidate division KSB1 bacterium]
MKLLIKSILDVALGLILLIALSPLLSLIAIAIKLDSKGPIIFKQLRAGKNGQPFRIYKFRTMVDNAVNMGLGLRLAQNDSRITTVGHFLRNWSLDELPQIINIIRGEMSFVGPRPAMCDQIEYYDNVQRKRLLMKPGITGWAQVNGRNSLTWEERMPLDVWYVNNFSLMLDFKIFAKTFTVLLFKKGLYAKTGINEGYGPSLISKAKSRQLS